MIIININIISSDDKVLSTPLNTPNTTLTAHYSNHSTHYMSRDQM